MRKILFFTLLLIVSNLAYSHWQGLRSDKLHLYFLLLLAIARQLSSFSIIYLYVSIRRNINGAMKKFLLALFSVVSINICDIFSSFLKDFLFFFVDTKIFVPFLRMTFVDIGAILLSILIVELILIPILSKTSQHPRQPGAQP